MDFFYDKQTRRYLQQFMRLFANFQIEIDRATETYRTVPVRYGDANRMAMHVLKQNSENVVNSAPFISCWIQALEISPDARRAPMEIDKVQVFEKKYNYTQNEYDNELGITSQIERNMPVPYNLTMQVDIWTSNSDQKFQLLEQILTLYNPAVDINSTDNPFDWTRLSIVELTGVQWTNRSIPTGVEDMIDIATLTFKMPIHLTVPARVTKQKLIHQIISSVVTAKSTAEMEQFRNDGSIPGADSSYMVTTFGDRVVNFTGTLLTLLDKDGSPTTDTWEDLFKERGADFRTGVSQIKLMDALVESESNFQVYGTLSDPTGSQLTATIDTDTLPTNSAETATVDAIIDPTVAYPGDGTLPAAADGQRYLVLNEVPVGTPWPGGTGTGTVGVEWASETSATSTHLNDVAHYNGLFVSVGMTGKIQSSPGHGEAWTERTSGTTEAIYGITYGNDQWIAVGNNATILTSPDAITWTPQTPPNAFTNQLRAVTWGNNQYVVVGAGGALITSPDGITWTEQSTPITVTIFDVIYANSLYIFVTWNGKIYTSPDAVTWTERTSGTTEHPRGIAYGNNTFVVTGVNDAILTSTDGITWFSRNSGITDGFYEVTFGNGVFVTAGTNGVIATSSNNGVSWTQQTSPTVKHIYGLTFGGHTFIGVAHNAHIVSSDVHGTHGNKYDIIQYSQTGSEWIIDFDSSTAYVGCPQSEHTVKSTCEAAGHTWGTIKFTQNAQDSKKWKWNGIEWISAIEANYPSGYWRLYL